CYSCTPKMVETDRSRVKEANCMSWTIATHHQPVWRSRANFIVAAKVDDTHWEQLWTQRLEHNQYLICCIPFFVYDLALGDVVSTQPRDSKQYVVEQVVNPSSHF